MKLWQCQKEKKRRVLFGAGVLAVVLILGAATANYWVHRSEGAKNSSSNRQQAAVDIQTVKRKDLNKRIVLSGQTVPAAQVDIAAKYQGRITAVNAELGQQVSAGQVLIVEDTGDVDFSILQNQADYAQAKADTVVSDVAFQTGYDKAKADYQRSLTDYNRNKTLYETGAVAKMTVDQSEQEMIDAKSALDSYTHQVNGQTAASVASKSAAAEKARQSVAALEKQRADMILRAPRSGIIGYRQAEIGALVQTGQKLLSVYDNSKMYVDCQVSEQDLAALQVGMKVEVGLDSIGKTLPGEIIYISPANDPQNLSFSLRIALQSLDPAVKSGMFTKTVVNAALRSQALVVPKDAVLEKNGAHYVFVINAQNVVEQRTVQVGATGDEELEITNGLKEGEKIAVTNVARLRSGITVTPHDPAKDRGDGK